MIAKRGKSSVRKAAKKAAPKKARKKTAKVAVPAKKSGKKSAERKIVRKARAVRKAAKPPRAAITAANVAAMNALGMPLAALESLEAPVILEGPLAAAAQSEPRVSDDKRRFAALWAFQFADAFAAANNPAVTSSVAGTTRIVAKMNAGDEIELATLRNPSGLLVVRTRTMEAPSNEQLDVKSHLVPRVGGSIDPGNVKELQVKNDFYETRTFARAALTDKKIMDASTVPPINNPENGKSAIMLGRTPVLSKFSGAEVAITAPAEIGPGATARVDDDYRFVLRARTSQLFPPGTPKPELKLEIQAKPPATDKLSLTYRIARDKFDDGTDTLPGANNTTRTKLIDLVPPPPPDGKSPIQAKDVPAIHLLLM